MGRDELLSEYRRNLLGESDLLGALEEPEIDRLLALATIRSVKRNELIVRKGQESDFLCILLSGRAAAVSTSREGKQVVVRLMDPGAVIGEVGLLDGLPRSLDVVAQESGDYLVLRRSDFETLVVERPESAWRMMAVVARRLRLTSEMLEDAVFTSIPERLAKTLLRLADRYGREVEGGTRIDMRLPQRLLAELVASTRETVNMQILAWESDEIIERVERKVVIRDRAALERIASG